MSARTRCHGFLRLPRLPLLAAVALLTALPCAAQVRVGSALDPAVPIDTIEVFRRNTQPIALGDANGSTVTVYVVDALQDMTDRLSVGLPKTPQAAQRVAQARFQGLTEQDKAVLRTAATAQVRATQYGLTKTPAIVFNGHAVVYGVSDVQQARSLYLRWRHAAGPAVGGAQK